MFSINPGHHHFKQYYYQEWTDRDRYIHDHIYPTYMSQDGKKFYSLISQLITRKYIKISKFSKIFKFFQYHQS